MRNYGFTGFYMVYINNIVAWTFTKKILYL